MNPQTLKYLQKDEIGQVIATGLAELYLNKPPKPVRYLAMWLKNYSSNQAQMASLLRQQKEKATAAAVYQKQVDAQAVVEKQNKAKQQQELQSHEDFRRTILNHEYPEDLLEQALPQFIQRHAKATGAYIGQLTYPHKDIKDDDTDELAHLDTSAQKIISYIGSSVSHKLLIRGKTLKLNQGVTSSAFSLLEEAPAPTIGEDGKQVPQVQKPKYLFIPNVVKNQSIHYFKIPKLGSYLAVPIICNQYLTQLNFDSVLKQKLDYLKQCEELEATKKTELDQLHKEKEELEKKIAELTQKSADEVHLQPIRAELKETLELIGQKQKQFIEENQPKFVGNIKSYVICADSLGQDRAFEQSEIDQITSLVTYFKNIWQNKEKQLLKRDVDEQIKGLQSLPSSPEIFRQQLMQSLAFNEEQQKQLAAITDENKKQHRHLQLEVGKIRAVLKENSAYAKAFVHLNKFRVIKYKQVIQNILFFLRYSKQQINFPNKTFLNWREIKKKIVSEETFHKILDYNPFGPKKQNYPHYSKTTHLLEIFDKFEEEEIFKYNIALGAITLFVKKVLELRESDFQMRKAKFEMEKKNRQKLLEENEKINTKLNEELQKHVGALSNQDAAIFNEGAWKTEFYGKHPLHEVPAEVQVDVDNDM